MEQTYKLFADRIGGSQFGKINKVFKFTLIDNAKKKFIADNPGVKCIDMGVGEPEERAIDKIAKRLYDEALIKENRIYPNNGTLPFKQAAARYLKRLLNLEFDPESEIVHCVGSKTALAELPFAFINPGDSIVATAPGYPVMPTIINWLGGKVHNLPLIESNKYLPDLAQLKDTVEQHNPKLLLLNYPNNPTGATADFGFYEKVVELAKNLNFIIVQDAAYSDYVYSGRYTSPLQISGGREVSIELYSLSKGFNMQGYRIGFVVSCPLLLKAFALVKDNIDNGQFIAVQKAGMEALDNCGDFLASNREKYGTRLETVASILTRNGIPTKKSPGSFYLYTAVPDSLHGNKFDTAQDFSDHLVANLGIINVPWEEAGPHIRFSMTFELGGTSFASEEELYKALDYRLANGKVE